MERLQTRTFFDKGMWAVLLEKDGKGATYSVSKFFKHPGVLINIFQSEDYLSTGFSMV